MPRLEEIPIGVGAYPWRERLDDLLPAVAVGYELISFESQKAESVVLRNRFGHILYQWADDYMPDFVDVLNVCKELGIA